jgi:hypothetical protein
MSTVGKWSEVRDSVKIKIGSIQTPDLEPTQEALDQFVRDGLNHFSKLRPRTLVKEYAGDGVVRRYDLPTDLGDDWVPGFSAVVTLWEVTDSGLNAEERTEIGPDQWDVRQEASADSILRLESAIPLGSVLRVEYITPHKIDTDDGANTTVDQYDSEVLYALAAARGAAWISRKSGEIMNTTLGVTEVDYYKIRDQWAKRAKELLEEASESLDSKMVRPEAAGYAVQWKSKSRLTSQSRISH